MLIGCIEAGGTKFVCGVCDERGQILDRTQFPTLAPNETMENVNNYFSKKSINAIGLGCFGPIDLKLTSKTYGFIKNTPKESWKNYNILGYLKKKFNVPIGFDTDVNSAALGEAHYGAAKGLQNVLYITIGTGIGAGVLVEGNLLHGMLHPEMGHILIRRHPDDDFEGICPYHKDCIEGLASGKSIETRYNKKAQYLTDDSVWKLEAYYIAQALMNYILILSPEKIIIGGGVSKQKKLLKYVRVYVKQFLNDYINTNELKDLEHYIVNPQLGDNAGLIGAFVLGLNALNEHN